MKQLCKIKIIISLCISYVFVLSFINATNINIELKGDSVNDRIVIKNKNGVIVSTITATGEAHFKNMYLDNSINAYSAEINGSLVIGTETVTGSQIANWDYAYTIVDGGGDNWNMYTMDVNNRGDAWNSAALTVKNSSSNWGYYIDIINKKRDNWDESYRTTISSYINWNSAYTLLNTEIFRTDVVDPKIQGKLEAVGGFETTGTVTASTGVFTGALKVGALNTTDAGAFEIGQDVFYTSNMEFGSVNTSKIRTTQTSGITLKDSNGVGRLFVEVGGNVGIGVEDPYTNLHLEGGDGSTGYYNIATIALGLHSGGYRQWIRTRHHSGQGDDNAIDFHTCNGGINEDFWQSKHALTINNGKVGIGTISPKEEFQILRDYGVKSYGLPLGTILAYAGVHIPSTWKECNGISLSVSDYPELYAVIGNTWGGDDINFNLPNLQGMFLRGKDSGKGVDPDRDIRVDVDGNVTGDTVGSYQGEAFLDHIHTSGSLYLANKSEYHDHDVRIKKGEWSIVDWPWLLDNMLDDESGDNSYWTGYGGDHNHGGYLKGWFDYTGSEGGVLPDRATVIYIIKAFKRNE